MLIESLRPGDFLWHSTTRDAGFVKKVEARGSFTSVTTVDGVVFDITQAGLDMWWDVVRDEVSIHLHTHDEAALKEGIVRLRGADDA